MTRAKVGNQQCYRCPCVKLRFDLFMFSSQLGECRHPHALEGFKSPDNRGPFINGNHPPKWCPLDNGAELPEGVDNG